MVRIATAVLLIALLVGALWAGTPWFAGFIGLMSLLAWREFSLLAAEIGGTPLRGLGGLAALACALAFLAPDPATPLAVLLAVFLAIVLAGLLAGRRHPVLAVRRIVATLGGVVWLGLLPGTQIALRLEQDGIWWLVLLYASVSGGDIAAYYGGSLVGRRPLAPALSPNKTVEGTLFGLAASVLAALLVDLYLLEALGPGRAAAVGLFLGVVGQAGDLVESALKRAARAKDASALLPGHGGVLDRIDGLLLGGAALYAILRSGWLT